jgi:hypothetical protein
MSDNSGRAIEAAGCIVSRVLGEGRGKSGTDLVYLRRGLYMIQAAPAYPSRALSRRSNPLRNGGPSRIELVREWDSLRVRDGATASFDPGLIAQFVEEELLGVLGRLLSEGPGAAAHQMEVVLVELRDHAVPPSRQRANGGAKQLPAP